MPTERSHRSLAYLKLPAAIPTLASLSATLMLGACSASTDLLPSIAMQPSDATVQTASADATPQTELQKATEYWGKEYEKNPGDLKTAMNYAKDLKALGEKDRALQVLEQAGLTHGNDRELAAEYGRLALELNKIGPASQALAIADDPTKPDWRVISARGTVMAKQGRYSDAIPFYERAQSLAPNTASVLNNLAMAYAMMGDPKKAEEILRQALAAPDATPKVRENLALVLGLQGRYDESKSVASGVVDDATATSNATFLKQMVKLDAKSAAPDLAPFTTKTTAVTTASTSSGASASPSADAQTVWATSVSSGATGNR